MPSQATDLRDFLDCLQRTPSPAAAFAHLYRTVARHGLRGAVYTGTYTRKPLFHGDRSVSTWIRHYLEQGYLDIDPPSIEARKTHLPQPWIAHQDAPHYTEQQRRIYQEIQEFGLELGTDIIIINDPAGESALCFYYGAEHRDAHSLHITGLTCLATHYTHEHIRQLYKPAALVAHEISARERDCLAWLSEGLNAAEIAERLAIRERTVHFHLSNARRKLKASSLPQAIAKAIRHSIL